MRAPVHSKKKVGNSTREKKGMLYHLSEATEKGTGKKNKRRDPQNSKKRLTDLTKKGR